MKNSKRILAVLLCVLMLISAVPMVNIFAANIVASGECGAEGKNSWVLDDEGTFTISGEGTMFDGEESRPWFQYFDEIKTVIIDYGITDIGEAAFERCYNLTSVSIPNSVTAIGNMAFDDCQNLSDVVIPESVTYIDDNAFSFCRNLSNIIIPKNVKHIGNYAFSACDSLTNIVIPDSVANIGECAFVGCLSLENIIVDEKNSNYSSDNGVLFNKDKTLLIQYPTGNSRTEYSIPNSVEFIGAYAFAYNDYLSDIIIPYGVKNIAEASFACCSGISNVVIPNSVTNIERQAFGLCMTLSCITIPDSVTNIADYAFELCRNLTNVIIPDSVTSIGRSVFRSCKSLTNITVNEKNQIYSSTNGILFDKEKTKLIQYPIGNTRSEYLIPKSVETIGYEAFADCENLTSIVISNSVKTIGHESFMDCYNLTNVTIGNGVKSIGESAFGSCKNLKKTNYTGTVDQWAEIYFHNIRSNPTYYSENLYINDELVENVELTTATKISDYAFNNCRSIESIVISDSVTSIGNLAFYYCNNLTNINIEENNSNYSSQDGVLFNNDKTELIKYPAGNSRTSYIIPDGVKSINKYAFFSCQSLTNITISDQVKYIGDAAFSLCENLESIIMPESVTDIGLEAFEGCGSFTIYGYKGSYAQQYAERFNRISFIALDDEQPCEHNSQTVTIPSTCKVAGYTMTLCSLCNEMLSYENLPLAEHKFTEWEVIPATINEQGKKTRTCKVCGLEETEIIPKLPSKTETNEENDISISFSDEAFDNEIKVEVTEDFTGKQFLGQSFGNVVSWNISITSNGEEIQPNEPVYVRIPIPEGFDRNSIAVYHINTTAGTPERMDITIEGDYICFWASSFSPYVIVDESSEHTHSYTSTVTSPTCTNEGYTVYTCSCGDSYVSDKVDSTNHKNAYGVKGLAATCTTDGYTGGTYCPDCEKYLEGHETLTAKGHHYNAVKTQPTCTNEGFTTYTCDCGDSYVADKINPTVHHNVKGKCTNCGYDFTKDCTCKCHSKGFTLFVWKIGNFFRKIFKKDKLCSCGAEHW